MRFPRCSFSLVDGEDFFPAVAAAPRIGCLDSGGTDLAVLVPREAYVIERVASVAATNATTPSSRMEFSWRSR